VLIPSIDLMNGLIVQLRHGERLMLQSDDLDGWLARFAAFPIVQVIDLDAAMGRGDNAAIVRRICAARRCQVGGGIRTPGRAGDWLAAGAARVIVGSALFDAGGVHLARAAEFRAALGADALVAAIDGRAGHVVVHGWKTTLPVTPAEAARALDPYVGALLYTHVDTEGALTGLDLAPVRALQAATTRPLIVAGGIRSRDEVDALDALGIDAVVGMAIYTGLLSLDSPGDAGLTR
jgi:phosphoribosylformimino-5-aminoimidazole carboxamide ribotide isomerase